MNEAAVIDAEVIRTTRETLKGKFPLMAEMFLEDSQKYVEDIRNAISARMVDQVRAPAHTLKSSSRLMGAMRLADLAMKAEALARQGETDRRDPDWAVFAHILTMLEDALAQTRGALARHVA